MTNLKSAALGASALVALSLTAGAAFAQDTLTGIRAVNDQLEDLEYDVQRDMNRANDAMRFSSPDYKPGLSGSASIGYSGKTGNNESQDFSLGLRIRHAEGQFVQTIGAVLDFQEADNTKTKEDVFAVYDANYYFDENFYAFALARIQTDGLAEAAGEIRRDGFLGVGPGYRIVNTPDMAWRLQAGIGVSYLQDGARDSTTDTGYIASSRFFYKFSDTVFLTNDTDVLKSDDALRVNNDFGVNFKVSDMMSTRVSYLTDYNDQRDIRSDNKLGVSLVFGF